MSKIRTANKIPTHVSSWTDKYFHQSAYGDLLQLPSKRLINFLSRYKKTDKIKLYRGVNKYNKYNYTDTESWTYDKKIAQKYIKETGGKVEEKTFNSDQILLDTTLLSGDERILLGYDYGFDDKEVLVLLK